MVQSVHHTKLLRNGSRQIIDLLFANAGVSPTLVYRSAAINEFGLALNMADLTARARALRRVSINEFNRAFILMQFFDYLRRNSNEPQDTNYTVTTSG